MQYQDEFWYARRVWKRGWISGDEVTDEAFAPSTVVEGEKPSLTRLPQGLTEAERLSWARQYQIDKALGSGDLPAVALLKSDVFDSATVSMHPKYKEDEKDPTYGRDHYEIQNATDPKVTAALANSAVVIVGFIKKKKN
jgi:hypothetical protein